jgi:hypothetical protein
VAIVECEAEAAGDPLELLVLDRQRTQLAQAGEELLFEPIDDGHATPQGELQQDWRFCTCLAPESIDSRYKPPAADGERSSERR